MSFLRSIVLFLILLIATGTYAQIKKFSLIETEFIEQFETFMMSTSTRSNEVKELFKEFETQWQSGVFDETTKKDIIQMSNLLLKKRSKPVPNFYEYLKAKMALEKSTQSTESKTKWQESLTYLLKKRNIREAAQFCESSHLLLNEQTLYESNATVWKTSSQNFTFDFDEKSPKIVFNTTTLKCYSKKDSALIYNTEGVLYPIDHEWIGKKGKVDWQRAGFASNAVYAELNNYKIDIKKSYYKADSVVFYNKTYYEEPMMGSLMEKIIANSTTDNASYPAFDSYEKIFEIPNIYPSIDYKGGFSMRGSSFIGSGNKDQEAYLFFKKQDTIKLKCRSQRYVFKKDQIVGRNTAVVFFFGQDSIYHPGLLFKYLVKERELNLIRDNDPQSMSRSPYYNTYHHVDMDIEQLSWKIDEDEIKMGAMKGAIVSKASFESTEYFRESRYNILAVNDMLHPLIALRRLAKKLGRDEMDADELAYFLKMDITAVRHLCMGLSYRGIIDYNIATERIKIKDRLYYYLEARVGKTDYDVIKFDSEHDMIGLENAALRLSTMELKLYGVQKIQVSDSQNVIFYPRGRQLILEKNRNFKFDGVIEAGLFTFYGQDFDFNYDDFKINLESIDSMKIEVESFETDEYGMKNLVEMQNVIENITGELLIDDPNNKSSVKNFPEYPIFKSKESSYVYYDKPSIHSGVYDRERFFFAVDPYEVDSLNSFTTEGLKFDGEFVSANIFPTFREKLAVQRDYSLGFIRPTPPNGYPIYEGKGTFFDTLMLSNAGLLGKGKVIYLNTTTLSDDLVFLPDSMNGVAQEYTIEKQYKSQGTEYPAVQGQNLKIHWEPYNDLWDSEQQDSAIVMYDGFATLEGGTTFKPEGLEGWGKFQFGKAFLTSDSYHFMEHEMTADTSSVNLIADEASNEFAFKTENVASYLDFNEKKATFKSNDEVTVVQFPQNKYVCYLNSFTWDMETEEMELGSSLDIAQQDTSTVVGSRFISVHPKQDTLNFVAPVARYDLKEYIIYAKEVETINVADAIVYPGQDGKITIHQNAKMETLEEAQIVTDNIKKHHKIYDATLDITGRLAYSGSGKYDYIDSEEKSQTIVFSLINVDSAYHTYATGAIAEPDSFMLSPEYYYQGKVRLNSQRKYLIFNGAALMVHECDTMNRYWLAFEAPINPNNIFIPVEEQPQDINKKNLYAAMFITKSNPYIYSRFLAKRDKFSDIPIITADGHLNYDEKTRKYIIADKKKIKDNINPGNMLSFHREYCTMFGEGELNFGVDLGQIEMTNYGTISHNIPMNKVLIETVMTLDFFFPENLLKEMGDTVSSASNLKPVKQTNKAYSKYLTHKLGLEESMKIQSEIQLYGGMKKFPKELEHAIVLNQLTMKWNPVTKSYKSIGLVGVGNIFDIQVNKQVKGYVEVAKKRTGDMLNIYIEINSHNWYFFSYQREVLQAYSSNDEFNDFIEEMKPKKKKLKVSKKEAQYEFYLSSETRKNIFIRKFTSDEVDEEDDEPIFETSDSTSTGQPTIGSDSTQTTPASGIDNSSPATEPTENIEPEPQQENRVEELPNDFYTTPSQNNEGVENESSKVPNAIQQWEDEQGGKKKKKKKKKKDDDWE